MRLWVLGRAGSPVGLLCEQDGRRAARQGLVSALRKGLQRLLIEGLLLLGALGSRSVS